MGRSRTVAAAGLIAAAMAAVVHFAAQGPVAAVRLGTDEAFAEGPHRRQVTSRGAIRWTGSRDTFRFERLPGGPATVDVEVAAHRGPVAVVIDGRAGATVAASGTRVSTPATPTAGRLRVTLQTVVPPGAPPGAQVGSITVHTARAGWPSWPVLLLFVAPAILVAGLACASGVAPGPALAVACVTSAFQAAVLSPYGLVRSPWAVSFAALMALAALVAWALARLAQRRRPGAAGWAFAAVLVACGVQVVLATSPVMVVSDVVFHANKLRQVAGGDWFPVSLTQHRTPFRFPYGVAFYGLLVPLARAGFDPARVVQYGAALSGVAASCALFLLLLPRGKRLAAAAVAALNLLPITFDVYSYGNLSNVFGQSLTVLFFAWWVGAARGGGMAGAALLALGALAHFSSFVVLGVLAAFLLIAEARAGTLDRARVVAVAAGLGAAAAYYLTFAPLVLGQLSRLGEGGGTGRVARGLFGELWDEMLWLRIRWGWPALVLLAFGLPRSRREQSDRLDGALAAFWAAGLVLAALAVTTPVEVRYVYALTLPAAAAMAAGAARLGAQGRAGWAAAAALAMAQTVVAAQAMAEALFERYR